MPSTKLPDIERWLTTSLQGLAFWIGHRRSLFSHYPLPEGALVAEACNLIQANLPSKLVLLPERLYRNLVPHVSGNRDKENDDRSRADLVICNKDDKLDYKEGNISDHVQYVIEVKRASSPKKDIENDLIRLRNCLQNFPGYAIPRTLLFVVSENGAPKCFDDMCFVDIKTGKAKRGKKKIPGGDGYYCVRRAIKASASFSAQSKAHYACIIEVLL